MIPSPSSILVSVTASVLASGVADSTTGAIVLSGMIAWAVFRTPVVGDAPVPATARNIEPAAVRRYREEHPGATITDALAALARR